ncbi:response regulator transcription factor [Cupriavidus necator]|uniref:response regulator transcription factor n=1 Tax=Cupriavidus necator TaxID=106590 RepID=UPI0009B81E05|nr:LuxR C-terminal-related transcriptional regulator [Cupriavidus necator]
MSPAKLTARESQILSLIAKGMSTNEIAIHLGVTLFTVRKHRNNISAKLDIHTTSKLVSFAIHHGNIADDNHPFEFSRHDSLSDREKEILRKLELGLTAKEIARNLRISPRTVSKHVENIRSKTGLKTLADLMLVSRQLQTSEIRNTHRSE